MILVRNECGLTCKKHTHTHTRRAGTQRTAQAQINWKGSLWNRQSAEAFYAVLMIFFFNITRPHVSSTLKKLEFPSPTQPHKITGLPSRVLGCRQNATQVRPSWPLCREIPFFFFFFSKTLAKVISFLIYGSASVFPLCNLSNMNSGSFFFSHISYGEWWKKKSMSGEEKKKHGDSSVDNHKHLYI